MERCHFLSEGVAGAPLPIESIVDVVPMLPNLLVPLFEDLVLRHCQFEPAWVDNIRLGIWLVAHGFLSVMECGEA